MSKKSTKKRDWDDPVPAFGAAMREQEFLLDPNITFLNHGSYGTTPRRVFERLQQDMLLYEQNPDKAQRRDQGVEFERVVQALAVYLGTSAANLALVENTTTGMANVLTTFPFQSGDAILVNNRTYGAMKNQVDDIIANRRTGLNKVEITYPFVIESEEQIVQLYRDAIAANPNIRLAVIDHIASGVPAVFPVKELTALCHENGIVVAIDGAHAPGHLLLNLDDIGMDFFVGNLHKWVFSGRGCAIQYVAPSHHATTFPCRLSVSFGEPYPTDFVSQGTRDDSAYHCGDYAVEFYNWIGRYEAVSGYCVPLLNQAVTMVTEAWGTDKLPIAVSMEAPFMKSVRVPDMPAYEKEREGADRLRDDLFDLYNIWTSIQFLGGEIYIRLSVNIYCTITDYELLRDAVLELQQESPTSDRQNKRKAIFKKKKCQVALEM